MNIQNLLFQNSELKACHTFGIYVFGRAFLYFQYIERFIWQQTTCGCIVVYSHCFYKFSWNSDIGLAIRPLFMNNYMDGIQILLPASRHTINMKDEG